MGDMVAREGRDLQRYDERGRRLLAGSIPWRLAETPDVQGEWNRDPSQGQTKGLEVLLVSSRRGDGLVLPKGGWESDEDVLEAAKRETWEEAGVLCEAFESLGTFTYRNKLGKTHPEALEGPGSCVAHMYACQVVQVKEAWPEQHMRNRVWCNWERALEGLKHEWMRDALLAWEKKLEKKSKHEDSSRRNLAPTQAAKCNAEDVPPPANGKTRPKCT
mmetsp:Transcript_1394/g.8600  ORF Transcript_1394/g.8600 Transcript_1394/m.8600 type:complete len:217 (-) Transcript_1394:3162-3812(-)